MRNKKRKSRLLRQLYTIIALSFSLVTMITVVALWQSNFSVENRFPIEHLDVSIEEEFNPPENWDGSPVVKKAVFKNEGTIPAVVRVQIVENFNLNDKLLSTKYTDAQNAEKDIVEKTLSKDWHKNGDWYYYNKILDSNESTSPFLDGIKYEPSLPDIVKDSIKGATYELSLIQEHVSIYDTSLIKVWNLADDFKLPSSSAEVITWKFKW